MPPELTDQGGEGVLGRLGTIVLKPRVECGASPMS
jgi:hypothetical protein